MLRTFNCGIGFVMCVPQDNADKVLAALAATGEKAMLIGQVVAADTHASADQLLVG